MMPKTSFKEGTTARQAASVLAEDIKEKPRSGVKVDNHFALSRYVVKRLSPAKRRAVASRR